MLNQRSFSEILEQIQLDPELNPQTTSSTNSINAGWESHHDPFYLAQLMGELKPYNSPSPLAARAYPAAPRPPHILNTEQAVAFQTLCHWSPLLKDNFNSRQLRSAYRLAVLKTHPDQGGSAETFQNVRKSYELLKAFVNK